MLRTAVFAAFAAGLLCACATTTSLQPPAQLYAQTAAPVVSERVDAEKIEAAIPAIESYLQEQLDKAALPSLVAGIVVGDRLVWAKGFGTRAPGSAEPVGPSTVFRIGSITKVFAGDALLRLRDAGLLDLDAPVALYLPELGRVLYPTRDSPPITVRHLVTHTSGLPRVGKLDYTRTDHEITEAEVIASLEGLKLDFVPGTRQSYSNLGMGLAGLIVERLSGMRFRDYVRATILEPLGMTSSFWDQEQVPAERLAVGHKRKGGMFVPEPAHWRFGASEAMGGLYSSLEDMARFVSWQLSAWPPRDEPESGPLARATLRESQLPAGLAEGGRALFGVNWGVMHDPKLGHLLAHTGSTLEYSATVRLLPRRGLGVVLLTGCAEADRITGFAKKLLELADQASPPPEPKLGTAAEIALGRIRSLMAQPSADAVAQAFSPMFLESVPVDSMLKLFGDLAQVGACSGQKVVSTDASSSVVHLICEKAILELSYTVREEEPHLLDGFLVRTAK